MVATAESEGLPIGWLRGPGFDLTFIGGITALALLAGVVVAADPRLLGPVVLIDLWLLGYHHVIATYTRLCFDAESRRQHAFLLYGLPPMVVGAVVLIALGLGTWAIPTLYLYWQWFHYTRQSWGIAQVYRRKAGGACDEGPWLSKAVIYLVPLWGILYRSWQAPESFLGMEIRTLPVPGWMVDVVGAAALVALGCWILLKAAAWMRGRLPVAHTLYTLSHLAVFYVGYIAIQDITQGWLVINVWHNAQYVLFVWLFNSNRFSAGVDRKAWLISYLSQPQRVPLYFGFFITLTSAVYLAIAEAIDLFNSWALPLTLLVYQALNFHHYIVDGVIWKIRRRPLQQTLGIAA